jgi:hypothetical protein
VSFPPTENRRRHRRSVAELHHRHLPKIADVGVIVFDGAVVVNARSTPPSTGTTARRTQRPIPESAGEVRKRRTGKGERTRERGKGREPENEGVGEGENQRTKK